MRTVRLLVPLLLLRAGVAAQTPADPRLDRLKTAVARAIDAQATFAQQMVDQVYSFGELGMQEVETSRYLAGMLERNGFALERGVAGIPTAWVARWGSGKPVIALGSDIDCIPQAARTSTASRRPARSRVWWRTIRSSPARPATARDTTAAYRSTSSRPSP